MPNFVCVRSCTKFRLKTLPLRDISPHRSTAENQSPLLFHRLHGLVKSEPLPVWRGTIGVVSTRIRHHTAVEWEYNNVKSK